MQKGTSGCPLKWSNFDVETRCSHECAAQLLYKCLLSGRDELEVADNAEPDIPRRCIR